MKVISSILMIIGAIDVIIALVYIIYTAFFGSVLIDIDFRTDDKSDAV